MSLLRQEAGGQETREGEFVAEIEYLEALLQQYEAKLSGNILQIHNKFIRLKTPLLHFLHMGLREGIRRLWGIFDKKITFVIFFILYQIYIYSVWNRIFV